MKSKWIIIFVILALLIGVAVLQDRGLLNIQWQWLTVLLASLLAPLKYLLSILTPNKDKIAAIKEQHQVVRDQEHEYQQQLEARVKEREAKIDILNKQLDVINARVSILEDKSKKVDEMVENMTIDEKKERFKELFGE